MTSLAQDRSALPRARSLAAALLALLCLLSTVELHRDHSLVDDHSPADLGSAGCHPALATHLEPPHEPGSRECPACLLRLVTRGAMLPAEMAFDASLAPLGRVAEQGFAARFAPPVPSLSRGPPSA